MAEAQVHSGATTRRADARGSAHAGSGPRTGGGAGALRGSPEEARPAVEVDPEHEPGRADDRRRAFLDRGRRAPGLRDAGLRGAIPVPPSPAPPAAGAPPLHHLPGDPSLDRRLLPGTAPGNDREPRPKPIVPALSPGRLAASALLVSPRPTAP